MNKYLCFVQTPLMLPQTSRRNLCNDIFCIYQSRSTQQVLHTLQIFVTKICCPSQLLWKAEIEVFNCSLQIFAWCRAVIHRRKHLQLIWASEESYFISWQIFVIKFKSHDMYIVPYDKYLRDAKVVYFMTNICEMQRLCILWQIFVRCRAGGKYLTVDTSHSPQWQSATSQGCPWPWRRGNAFWIKVENNGCCSFVHLCANAMLLGRIDLSLSPAPDWRANVHFLSHLQPICT